MSDHTNDGLEGDHARLVALAREMLAKVRENGHDIRLDCGFSFRLGVSEPVKEDALVRGKGLISFALGVDLTPYSPLFASQERDRIIAEVLAEA